MTPVILSWIFINIKIQLKQEIDYDSTIYLFDSDGRKKIFGIIGVRYARGCHPSDFWVKYFTSSSKIKTLRNNIGDPDIIEIRRTFQTKEEAREWEIKVLKRMKVVKNGRWLNKTDRKGPTHSGILHSTKTKELISRKKKGQSPPNKGIPSSTEATKTQREKLLRIQEILRDL